MNQHNYFSTHPGFEEMAISNSSHKLLLITPDTAYAKESLEWVSDKEVSRYVGADFSNVSLESERERLEKIIQNKDTYNWLIECDDEVIGNVNISDIKETSGEFGVKAGSLNYIIGDKRFWGNGITSSAVRAILRWAFTKNDFEVIKSRVIPQNKGSIAVLLKANFETYGKEDYEGPDIGESTWYTTYKLTKEKWLEVA